MQAKLQTERYMRGIGIPRTAEFMSQQEHLKEKREKKRESMHLLNELNSAVIQKSTVKLKMYPQPEGVTQTHSLTWAWESDTQAARRPAPATYAPRGGWGHRPPPKLADEEGFQIARSQKGAAAQALDAAMAQSSRPGTPSASAPSTPRPPTPKDTPRTPRQKRRAMVENALKHSHVHKAQVETIEKQRGVVFSPGGFMSRPNSEVAVLDHAVQRRIRGLLPHYHAAPELPSADDADGAPAPTPRRLRQPFRPITDAGGNVLEHAPLAPRPPPSLLPTTCRMKWITGAGYVAMSQAQVAPRCWALTIEQTLGLLEHCMETMTWQALSDVKGRGNITMRDLAVHFLLPWTHGTGCSIAVLMSALGGGIDSEEADSHESEDSEAAEAFVCHAWDGAVVETHAVLRQMGRHMPLSTRIWMDAFSLYLPEDGAHGGLMHAEQFDASSEVIESRPALGVFVVHTTTANVYERLWVLHELWLASKFGLQRKGLVDTNQWSTANFSSQGTAIDHALDTPADCACERWQDRAHLLHNKLADVEPTAVTQVAMEVFQSAKEELDAHGTRSGRLGSAMAAIGRTLDFTAAIAPLPSPLRSL